MNNPIDSSPETARKARNAFWVAVVFAIASLGAIAVFLVPALQTNAWQLYLSAGVSLFTAVVSVIGIRLIKRGRLDPGIGLIIGVSLPAAMVSAALIVNVGLVLGPSVALIVSVIAIQTLSPQGVRRAIIAAIVAGIIMTLLGWFGAPYQLAVSQQSPLFLAILVSGLVLIYGFFVIQRFADYTLQVKLIIAFLAVSLIPMGALLFLNNRTSQTALIDSANQSLLAAASQVAVILDDFINANKDAVRVESQLPAIIKYLGLPPDQRAGSPGEADVFIILNALSRKNPVFISSYALLDSRGIDEIDTYAPDIGLDKSKRDYFQTPLETGLPYASSIRFSDTVDELALYFSSPVRDASGEIIGVLRVRYNASILQQFIRQNNGLAGPESFAVLLDENHIRMAHGTEPDMIFKTVIPLEPARLKELQAAGRLPDLPADELSTNIPAFEAGLLKSHTEEPFFTTQLVATADVLDSAAIASMETQPWLAVFAQPQNVFLAPVQTQTRNTLVLAALIVGVVIAAAVFFAQILARPIINLTVTARQVAGGDLNVRAPIESRDETGQLAEVFNSMTDQLQGIVGSLEEQVQERMAELALSMEVGQRASTIRDLDELLPTIIEFIRNRFDLYYAHIYFLDDLGQKLVIRAGTGAVGKELMARRHNLPVGGNSIVGRVAADGQSIVVSDTEQSDIHMPNPLLPKTRSELAVPLTVEGRVVGVLDMQADTANTFTEQNLTVFEAMATQLAISIDGAQLWALSVDAQQKSEQALRQLARQVWTEKLASQQESLGYMYDLSSITPLKSDLENGVSVPIVVQNQPIGRLSVAMPANRDLSDDEHTLLEAVTQQLAQKAENLRLFEQTQQRAAREQLTRQITDKIRASRDIESAMKTAAQELSRVLGTARATVDLKVELEEQGSKAAE